ncbi:MAG TPA: hypothetical protein VNW92_08760, partial [Polyangiaceae bacterium]|nr:hypothetical protein [Polyangiaceae bacterium]
MGILNLSHAGLVALVLCASCVPTFDDQLSIVSEPKLLAIQSEPAEAAPGDSVTLSALVADPSTDPAAPTLSWGLCIARKPLTELGPVNPVCLQLADRAPRDAITALGRGAAVSATLPMDACRLFGPSLPEAMNGQPAGRPVDPDPTGGFYQPVTVTLVDSTVTSLGDVRLACPPSGLDQDEAGAFSANYRRNENPSLASVALVDASGTATPLPDEPEALRVAPGQALYLVASWAACPTSPVCGDAVCGALEDNTNCPSDCTTPKGCTGAESYAWWNPDARQLESRHESMRVSWYATAGQFENPVTGRDEDEYD